MDIRNRWNKLVVLLKNRRVKSLNNISLFGLLRSFLVSINDGWITMRASAISFNFFMAIPPILLFVFSILPYFHLTDLYDEAIVLINEFMPKEIQKQLTATINEIVNIPNRGFISVSVVLTIYFASNGFLGILNAFNSSVQISAARSWWKQQAIAILLFFITIFVIGMVIVFQNIQSIIDSLWVDNIIESYYLLGLGIKALSSLFILLFVYVEVRILFYFGTIGNRNLPFYSIPALLTTLIIGITSVGFNFYISNFSRYNILYGSIGTIMLFLLWLYVNAIVLIAGFELHTSFVNAKRNINHA